MLMSGLHGYGFDRNVDELSGYYPIHRCIQHVVDANDSNQKLLSTNFVKPDDEHLCWAHIHAC